METVHDFLDRAVPVPPVHVEEVDVTRAKLPERVLDGNEK